MISYLLTTKEIEETIFVEGNIPLDFASLESVAKAQHIKTLSILSEGEIPELTEEEIFQIVCNCDDEDMRVSCPPPVNQFRYELAVQQELINRFKPYLNAQIKKARQETIEKIKASLDKQLFYFFSAPVVFDTKEEYEEWWQSVLAQYRGE